MSAQEYQELIEYLGPKFDFINNRFEAIDQRFERLESKVDFLHTAVANLSGEVREIRGEMKVSNYRVTRLEDWAKPAGDALQLPFIR